MNYGSRRFSPTPPDKGSFPLDHDGECKAFMKTYMQCLEKNSYEQGECREQAKEYLQCRMDKQLMAKENFKNLGFKENTNDQS